MGETKKPDDSLNIETRTALNLESLKLLREVSLNLLKSLDPEGKEILEKGLNEVEDHILAKFNKETGG